MSWREVTYYQPTDPQVVIHGPMWQPECETCDWMGDVDDSEDDARRQASGHTCRPMSADERLRKMRLA